MTPPNALVHVKVLARRAAAWTRDHIHHAHENGDDPRCKLQILRSISRILVSNDKRKYGRLRGRVPLIEEHLRDDAGTLKPHEPREFAKQFDDHELQMQRKKLHHDDTQLSELTPEQENTHARRLRQRRKSM